MTRYAEGTSVPIERSRAEIEKTLQRYAADGFGYAMDRRVEITPAKCMECGRDPDAMCFRDHRWRVQQETKKTREVVFITFRMKDRKIRLEIPMPTEAEAGTKAKHEAAIRQRWRALVLVIKAKLEAVASGISSLEAEFLANVVLPNDHTIGEMMVYRLPEIISTGRLLPAHAE